MYRLRAPQQQTIPALSRLVLSAMLCAALMPMATARAQSLSVTVERDPRRSLDFETDTALNSPPSNGWSSIRLNVSAASNISRVTVDITGYLHQRWAIAETGEYVTTPIGTSLTNGDSHLLIPANATNVTFLIENNNVHNDAFPWAVPAPDTETRDYGIGSHLRGSWAIPPASQTSSIPVAYLVVPRDFGRQTPIINIAVQSSTGGNQLLSGIVCEGGEGFIGICDYDPPEVGVLGNNRVISDNDSIPSLLDGTNFGVVQAGSEQVRTFNIRNVGDAPLTLELPTLTGPFSLVDAFPQVIEGGLNQIFRVALDTSARGSFQGSISFGNNDANESPYNFVLSATVIPEPASSTLIGLALLAFAGFAPRQRPQVRQSPRDFA